MLEQMINNFGNVTEKETESKNTHQIEIGSLDME